MAFVKSDRLEFLHKTLKNISALSNEAYCIETIFAIIARIASLMSSKYSSEEEAQRALRSYVSSLSYDEKDIDVWVKRLQKNLNRWLPKIFRCISFPFLPTTNNDLETFNLKIKKLYRKITGRKNSHLFLFSSGVATSYVLSSDFNISVSDCCHFEHQDITLQKELLFDLKRKALAYRVKTNLDDFLFDLEVLSGQN